MRFVCYDHRGHGSSGSAPAATYTIDQLGADLDVVLRTVVPRGLVVLVGHSMGAMTALAYLRAHPEVVGTRVAAVGLISAVAAGLTDSGLGRYLHHRAVVMLEHTARVAPGMLVASRRIGRRACTRITRHGRIRHPQSESRNGRAGVRDDQRHLSGDGVGVSRVVAHIRRVGDAVAAP